MAFHIGQKVKEILEKRGMSKAELGRKLSMTSTNVHKIFKRESIDTKLLENLSILLEHNFFAYIISELPISVQERHDIQDNVSRIVPQSEMEALRKQIKMQEKLIEFLEAEVESLKSKRKQE